MTDSLFDEDFIPEIEENLEGFESVFLDLSPEEISEESINKIAFYAHNFKGSSQIAGLNDLAKFLHEFENVLSGVKKSEFPWGPAVCDFFFDWIDKLKEFGEEYSQKNILELDVNWIIECREKFKAGDVTSSEIIEASGPTKSETEKSIQKKSKAPTKDSSKGNKKEDPGQSAEFIRTSIEKLDILLNYVGELVVNQAVLNNHRENNTIASKGALETIEYLDKIVNDISSITLSLRMVPLKQFFQKIKRISRDVAKIEGKKINIIIAGDDVELDKTIVDKITDPIIHIVKNAVDHGIESHEERVISGKNEVATLTARAVQKESVAELIIEDDGGGINKERVLSIALEKGIITPDHDLTDDQIYALIFNPGFSTKEDVTEISGRGVGMDVAKKVIDELQGNIHISSSPNGTTFTITLPLSLSIINGMIIRIDDQKYIVPISQLQETIELKNFDVKKSGGGRRINLRGEVIPVISIRSLLKRKGSADLDREYNEEKGLIVIVDGEKLSFEVDEIVEQQQIVVKKFGEEMEGVPGLSAGAILGDGQPGIILNLQEFITEGVKYG